MTDITFNSAERISGFLSFEDIHQIKSGLKVGQSLVLENTGNGFTAYVGTIKHKSTRVIGKITPGYSPANIDDGERNKHIRTKSWATPPVTLGFKSAWEDMINAPKNHEDLSVSWFMEELEQILSGKNWQEVLKKLSYHIVVDTLHKTSVTEITIKDYPRTNCNMSVGFTPKGNALYMVYNGVKSEL